MFEYDDDDGRKLEYTRTLRHPEKDRNVLEQELVQAEYIPNQPTVHDITSSPGPSTTTTLVPSLGVTGTTTTDKISKLYSSNNITLVNSGCLGCPEDNPRTPEDNPPTQDAPPLVPSTVAAEPSLCEDYLHHTLYSSPEYKKEAAVGGRKTDVRRTCEYVDGLCTQHGVRGRRRWKPTGRKTRVVGRDGQVSWKAERHYWQECDIGARGHTMSQSRISFLPVQDTRKEDPIKNSNNDIVFVTHSEGQGK